MRWRGMTWARLMGMVGVGVLLAGPVRADESLSETLLSRWRYESGGGRKLKAAKTVQIKGRWELPAVGLRLPFESFATQEGMRWTEYELAEGASLTEFINQNGGWYKHSELGVGEIPALDLAELRRWDDVWLPLYFRDWYPQREQVADANFGGVAHHAFAMTPTGGVAEQWYFDFDSGRLVGMTRPLDGWRAPVGIEFFDESPVAGIVVPRRVVRYQANGPSISVRDSVKVNVEIPDGLWELTPAEIEQAAELSRLMERHFVAMGFDRLLSSVTSRVTRSRIESTTSGVTTRAISYRKMPGLALEVQEVEGVGMSWRGFDGQQGWEYSEITGYRLLEGAELAQMAAEANLRQGAFFRVQNPLGRELRKIEFDGKEAWSVKLASLLRESGDFVFDAESGFILQIKSTIETEGGGNLPMTLLLGDYRQVDGVSVAMRMEMINPAIRTVTTVDSVEQNVELPDGLFAPRPDGEDPFPAYSRWDKEEAKPETAGEESP